jgi:hypothetical protein
VDFNQVRVNEYGATYLVSYDTVRYQITVAPNGVKTLSFSVYRCFQYSPVYVATALINPEGTAVCVLLAEPTAETFTPVQEIVGDFLNDTSDAPHKIVYGKLTVGIHRSLTSVQPAAPTDPYMLFYDGITNDIVNLDLTTFAVLSEYTVPISAFVSAFSIVPPLTGAASQIWAASPQQGIFVVNVSNGTLVASIPIPSLNPSNIVPVGIGFTNDGAAAFYAVSYYTADS